MSLRDDLIPVVDEIREDVIDGVAGLRLYTVTVRTRTWSGGAPGRGTATNVDITLSPKPKVSDPSPRMVYGQQGAFEEGDRIVSKISATYTAAQLRGTPANGAEIFWLIGSDEYKVVGEPQVGYLGWTVHLRRRHRQAAG
jgi:hypothetical protein